MREDGELWTDGRDRNRNEDDRTRMGERDRDRHNKDGGIDGDGGAALRRNGAGRGKLDQPWVRDDSRVKEIANGRPTGRGWRDREQQRDNREWNKGGKFDDDPEWMDASGRDEKEQAHTADDFERWKQQQRIKSGAIPAAENKTETPLEEPVAAKELMAASKTITPAAFDGPNPFGMWAPKAHEGVGIEEGAATPKAQPVKGKTAKASRFATLFDPSKGAAAGTAAPPEPKQVETSAPAISHQPNASSEDKEGFQRILQMLGGASLASKPAQSPAPPPLHEAKSPANGDRPFTSPEKPMSRNDTPEQYLQSRQQPPRSREQNMALVDAAIAPRAEPRPLSTDQQIISELLGRLSPHNSAQGNVRSPLPDMERNREPLHSPPDSRATSMHEAAGLQGIFGQQQQPTQHSLDDKSQFLLNLMQQNNRATSTQMKQPQPRQMHDSTMLAFLQNQQRQAQPMNVRGGLPPGFDEQAFAEHDMMQPRHQQEQQRHQQEPDMPGVGRKQSQRAPPGFFDDPAITAMPRRNTGENGPRQNYTNMGIPSHHMTGEEMYHHQIAMQQQQEEERMRQRQRQQQQQAQQQAQQAQQQQQRMQPPPGLPQQPMRQPPPQQQFFDPRAQQQHTQNNHMFEQTKQYHQQQPPRGMFPPQGPPQTQGPPGIPPPGFGGPAAGPPGFPPMVMPRDMMSPGAMAGLSQQQQRQMFEAYEQQRSVMGRGGNGGYGGY